MGAATDNSAAPRPVHRNSRRRPHALLYGSSSIGRGCPRISGDFDSKMRSLLAQLPLESFEAQRWWQFEGKPKLLQSLMKANECGEVAWVSRFVHPEEIAAGARS